MVSETGVRPSCWWRVGGELVKGERKEPNPEKGHWLFFVRKWIVVHEVLGGLIRKIKSGGKNHRLRAGPEPLSRGD